VRGCRPRLLPCHCHCNCHRHSRCRCCCRHHSGAFRQTPSRKAERKAKSDAAKHAPAQAGAARAGEATAAAASANVNVNPGGDWATHVENPYVGLLLMPHFINGAHGMLWRSTLRPALLAAAACTSLSVRAVAMPRGARQQRQQRRRRRRTTTPVWRGAPGGAWRTAVPSQCLVCEVTVACT